MEGDAPDKSKYNEGLLQIQRLHEIWVHCHSLRRQDNLIGHVSELSNAWSELSRDANKLSFIHQKKIDVFSKQIKSCYGNVNSIKGIEYVIKNREKLRKIILKEEIYLKEIQDLCGKGGSYKDDSSEDFE